MEILDILLTASFWAAAVRIASPLIFATLGELICERAGVLNLGIEGIMVIGAFTGDRVANRGGHDRYGYEETTPRQVQSCQTVNEVQQRLNGYQVSYEYRGQLFTTVLPHDPGRNLQVRVSVDPVLHPSR